MRCPRRAQQRRLTYHPGADRVRGWTPDGCHAIFASARSSAPQQSYFQLWSISVEGGRGSFAHTARFQRHLFGDGRRVAYESSRLHLSLSGMKPAIGGTIAAAGHIRSGHDGRPRRREASRTTATIPRRCGLATRFISSDRNHTVNLFSYRLDTKQVTQLTRHDDFDIMTASAGADAVVYEQAGYLYLLEAKGGQARKLAIEVNADLPWARPQFKKVVSMIRNAALSPTGVRAAFEARGEIFTVPAEKGDYRNLTQSSGAHDRSPVWSPDGAQLAWLSDSSAEYQLMIGDPLGVASPRAIALPLAAFYSAPSWSPDGKAILLQDGHRNLWTIEIANGTATKIDSDTYPDPIRQFDASWSPDSRLGCLLQNLASHMRAIFVYSLADKATHQITDGLADSISPAFDAGGKYLYFLASTNYGPSTGWLEMSSIDRPVRRAIYLTVLSSSEPSPLLPETGDEPPPPPATPPQPAPPAPKAVTVRIDFDRIGQRILAVNVPAGDYGSLIAGAGDFLLHGADGAGRHWLRSSCSALARYQVKERTAAPFSKAFVLTSSQADKKKVLYQANAGGGTSWGVVATDRGPVKTGDGPINVAQLEMRIDPRREWEQIFARAGAAARVFLRSQNARQRLAGDL